MKYILVALILSFSFQVEAQKTLSKLLKQNNSESVPYISVEELAMPKTKAVLLDARELDEYNVSHLQDAIQVGYNKFKVENVSALIKDKSIPIVVYCSLGIRSENVAEKLQNAGYTNVKNLYGGIFEWKNKNRDVVNSKNKVTDSIHAFSKSWSKWLKRGIKYYPKQKKNDR